MKPEEAIKGVIKIWKGYTAAYAEIAEEDVKAFDMAIEALEKQMPMPVQYTTDCTWGIEEKQPVCPECDSYLSHIVFISENGKKTNKISYCEWCGQAIDWSDDDAE